MRLSLHREWEFPVSIRFKHLHRPSGRQSLVGSLNSSANPVTSSQNSILYGAAMATELDGTGLGHPGAVAVKAVI